MNWLLGFVAKDDISGSRLSVDFDRVGVSVEGGVVDEVCNLVATGLSDDNLHPNSNNIEHNPISSCKRREDLPALF